LLSIGRLAPEKDHRTAISALRAVPDADLVILGEGDRRADLEAYVDAVGVRERVFLPGNIPPDQVPLAIARAEVVLQTSILEAFSMLIQEVMAMGKPHIV
jgi:glycosyltransferase involved in cell wall biosynthesis